MSTSAEVLFSEVAGKEGDLGVITLNRPQVLNSLNHTMIHAIHRQLKQWQTAPHIKAVVIGAAEGRAFCAGGDLRLTYERTLSHDPALTDFFRDEYHLNRCIFHYPKPYIALLDGITMGGGVGISIHGSHRVATERLVFAMPETGIGFFPDVGGTYFLPRLSGYIGYYLGLTGSKINSDDCVALNLAQTKVQSDALPQLIAALAHTAFGADANLSVSAVIEKFKVSFNPSELLQQQAVIDACFSKPSMEEIMYSLQHSTQKICQDAKVLLAKKSPTSLKITLRALHAGKHLDFDAEMRQEYRLATRFLYGHDFPEGIRAVIIDKDQHPNWQPTTLEAVTSEQVEKYFSPLTQELA